MKMDVFKICLCVNFHECLRGKVTVERVTEII